MSDVLSCVQITEQLNIIRQKKCEFDVAMVEKNISKALNIREVLEPILGDLIEKINTITIEGKKYRVTRTLVGGKDVSELFVELQKNNIVILDRASQMLNHSINSFEYYGTLRNKPEITKTVCLEVSDFGFTEPVNFKSILIKAKEIGLKLNLPEFAIFKRLQDLEQVFGEEYTIAMEPIVVSGEPSIFRLHYQIDSLHLSDWFVADQFTWQPSDKIVFRLNKYSFEE